MIRRMVLTAVMVLTAGLAGLAAAERASFILTDGERKSGTVAFHGDAHENLMFGKLNLAMDEGKDLSFPVEHVAVIDFVGGQPSPVELAALPKDNANFLVLRSGYSERGRFVNMVGGETVLWQNEARETQKYGIRDVARIYLNTDSARTFFNYRPNDLTPVETTQAVTPVPGAIQVSADKAWTDTGIAVKKGDRVSFRTSGTVAFGKGETQKAGPDGNGDTRNGLYPVGLMPAGALIGKAGSSPAFPIGSNSEAIVMPADGHLMLGINDNEIADNSGAFSVVVTVAPRGR